MKVKNLFSNRRTKKKKNSNQAQTSVAEITSTNSTDKLIIQSADIKEENEHLVVTGACVETSAADKVVLRRKDKSILKQNDVPQFDDLTKPRASSSSSTGSGKGRTKRPWSFIDQIRRQDSRDSACSSESSIRTSQVVEDLMSSTPPPHYDVAVLTPNDTARPGRSSSGALTLPRSLTPELMGQEMKLSRKDNASKRRTMDFRLFSFFKRSTDSDSSVNSLQGISGRSSLRGKGKNKKKQGSKKKKEPIDLKSTHATEVDNSRTRSQSDGASSSSTINMDEDAFQTPPPGLYDSNLKLNTLTECPEPSPEKMLDKRVPENGESASEFATFKSERHSTSSLMKVSGSRKYQRRSDPTNEHSLLRMQVSVDSGLMMMRSNSESSDPPSRRSSTVCEPRDLPLPEDTVATFDSSTYLEQRFRSSHGSVPHIPTKVQYHQNIQSRNGIGAQARCSQSVINLASHLGDSTSLLPRSSSDADKQGVSRSTPKPSLHQHRMSQNTLTVDSDSLEMISPPSPVLRAIGYPGVVLRRSQKNVKHRPTLEQRSKLVMSLNVEDLPTYNAQVRLDELRLNGYPSCEDILKDSNTANKRGSSGAHFSGAAFARMKRRGATVSNHGLRRSVGFSNAASVDDLDSLSSSNFGSKQSLSDLTQLDEDEILNGRLSKRNAVTHTSSGNLRVQEPSSKKAKAIRKSVASLANLISPGKPNQKSKLQRSSSFKESGSSAPASNSTVAYSFKPYRPPSNTPNKKKNNRRSKLWCETFDHTGLTEGEIKRQEAMFELYQGERDLVEDLTMAKQTYRDSMVTLKMLSDEEVALIFGKLGCLLPLHEDLLAKLEQARGKDGRTLAMGYIFVEWFPRISNAYREYCANQSDAKYALDAAVERDARVRDFLQRCLESPFSRKLDLWSYLDLPRTRLVKYPLLLQNVLKRTPEDLVDERRDLSKVMEIIGKIIEKVDETTGEQQCRYIRSKLEYLDEKQKSHFVENSRLMLCSGQLKNNRGTKLHVFLFEEALVLTRQTTRSNKVSYQVYRHPLPLRSLVIDVNEGDKLSGSFRGGIRSSEKVKHSFRIRSEELNATYTLQASEEHDRKQWINAIQEALFKYRAKYPELVMSTENHIPISKRRATYDPSKKYPNRPVNRSSSDKSNTSVASSTDKSSNLDESQDDDVSTASEDVGPWTRLRSQTVDISIKSKSSSSVSRKSSDSSTKSDSSKKDGKSPERSRNLESDDRRPSISLRDSLRKKSLTRHFSLGKGDKASKAALKTIVSENEKERNQCQRSRSLTASPQTAKSLRMRFGSKRFPSASSGDTPSAAKPPIAPSSPFSVRRSNSFKPPGTLHEAQSTPDLATITRAASYGSKLDCPSPHNTSNSVGNLREALADADHKLNQDSRRNKSSSESDSTPSSIEMQMSITFQVEISPEDHKEAVETAHEIVMSVDADSAHVTEKMEGKDSLPGDSKETVETAIEIVVSEDADSAVPQVQNKIEDNACLPDDKQTAFEILASEDTTDCAAPLIPVKIEDDTRLHDDGKQTPCEILVSEDTDCAAPQVLDKNKDCISSPDDANKTIETVLKIVVTEDSDSTALEKMEDNTSPSDCTKKTIDSAVEIVVSEVHAPQVPENVEDSTSLLDEPTTTPRSVEIHSDSNGKKSAEVSLEIVLDDQAEPVSPGISNHIGGEIGVSDEFIPVSHVAGNQSADNNEQSFEIAVEVAMNDETDDTSTDVSENIEDDIDFSQTSALDSFYVESISPGDVISEIETPQKPVDDVTQSTNRDALTSVGSNSEDASEKAKTNDEDCKYNVSKEKIEGCNTYVPEHSNGECARSDNSSSETSSVESDEETRKCCRSEMFEESLNVNSNEVQAAT